MTLLETIFGKKESVQTEQKCIEKKLQQVEEYEKRLVSNYISRYNMENPMRFIAFEGSKVKMTLIIDGKIQPFNPDIEVPKNHAILILVKDLILKDELEEAKK